MKMRYMAWLLAVTLAWCGGMHAEEAPVENLGSVEEMRMTGNVTSDSCEIKLHWQIRMTKPGYFALVNAVAAPLGEGTVTGVKESFWRGAPEGRVVRDGNHFWLESLEPGLFLVSLKVALPVACQGAVRSVALMLPNALKASFALHFAPNLVDFKVPDALSISEADNTLNGIWGGGAWHLEWKTAVEDQAGLVVGYDASTAVAVKAGTVRTVTDFDFSVTQGELRELVFRVPPGGLVSAVNASCRMERWNFDPETRELTVYPVRLFPAEFQLTVCTERALGALPEKITLAPVLPQHARANNSAWIIGAGPGIKLQPVALGNLIQTAGIADLVQLASANFGELQQLASFHAAGDFEAVFDVAAVIPVYNCDSETTLQIKDGSLAVRYDAKLSVRDAPLKELTICYDGALELNRLQGDLLRAQDYELEKRPDGRKAIRLTFAREVTGTTSFTLYFEEDLKKRDALALTGFDVEGARGGRGTLLVTAEPGLQLEAVKSAGITAVHPDTLAVKVAGLLQAYLYRESNWTLSGSVEVAPRHITGEVFSLVSAGESGAYGLTLFPFHLAGAPTDQLIFQVSDRYENVEFRGVPLARTQKIDEKEDDGFYLLEVNLRGRHSGDLVMLASYEISPGENGVIPAGAIGCVGAEPEARYIAVSGLKSMSSKTGNAASAQEIDVDELPLEYRNMISNQLLQAFRGGDDQGVEVILSAFAKDPLPPLLVSRADYQTRIAANGQMVTDAVFQVKNATAQFLPLRLPPEAQLWQVKVDDRPERASLADGMLMIPLARPSDINQVLTVAISYAQNLPPPADGVLIDFQLPEVSAPILTRHSRFELPVEFTVDGGTATGAPAPSLGQLANRSMLQWAARFLPLWVIGLVFGAVTLLAVHGWARHCRWQAWVGGVLSFGALAIWGIAALLMGEMMQRFLLRAPTPVNVVEFTDAADFGMASPSVGLWIRSVGTAPVTAWSSLIAGAVILAAALAVYLIWHKRWVLIGGGALAVALGCVWATQTPESAIIMILTLLIGGALAFPAAVNVAAYRYWKRTALIGFFALATWSGVGAMEVSDYSVDLAVNGENAAVMGSYTAKFAAGETLLVAHRGLFLTDWELPEECSMIKNSEGDWVVQCTRAGAGAFFYTGIAALTESDGVRGIQLWLPAAFQGRVETRAPDGYQWDAEGAVTREMTEMSRVFRFDGDAGMRKFDLVRRSLVAQPVDLQATFRSELTFRRDAVLVDIRLEVTIPQGETADLEIAIPPGLSVTRVEAPGINTWRFDVESYLLKVYFNQPLHGAVPVNIQAARHWSSLPEKWNYVVPKLAGARLQHGAVMLYSAPDVRLAVRGAEGGTLMGNEGAATATASVLPVAPYSYGAEAEFQLEVEEVKPELRVEEQSEVRYEDERITVSSLLLLEVLKGGIFSADILIPAGFEVSSLSGIANGDWDEIREKDGAGCVRLHFRERLTGSVRLQLRLTRLADGAYAGETVPRITVVGAAKLSGVLTVAAERGTTLTVTEREGVALADAVRDQSNSLIFKLLNPAWRAVVKFEATPPWIQVNTLQSVRMRLNSVDTELEAAFKIENNGVKALTVQLPPNWTLPEFDGANIGKMVPLGNGVWRLEMTRKIEREYLLRIRGRLTPEADGSVRTAAVTFPEAAAQSGYLAVYTSDSLELKPPVLSGDITVQNSRNLPPELSRMQSSAPVAAFRTVGTHWDSVLTGVSNQTAGVVKATGSKLELVTTLADTGVLLTRGVLTVENNGEAFLRFTLPAGAEFWGAKVNSIPVEAVRSPEGKILLPVENGIQQVELFYITRGTKPEAAATGVLEGPLFELPLKNIRWELFYTGPYQLRRTGGSLEERKELARLLSQSEFGSREKGGAYGKRQPQQELMSSGRSLTLSGDIQASNKMMQSALDMTADVTLRNDLAGEMLLNNREFNMTNISKRQMSLARTRAQTEVTTADNAPMEMPMAPAAESNPYLQEVADKIFTQQQAVYAAPQIFELAWLPTGREMVFEREMEINREAPLRVEFTWEGEKTEKDGRGAWAFGLIALAAAALLWCLIPPKKMI